MKFWMGVSMTTQSPNHHKMVFVSTGVQWKWDGRYWIRTSDPFRVKEVRYRCANRPTGRA